MSFWLRSLVAVSVSLVVGRGAAQEPAFFYGNGAMRYAEAPGYFHYVFPCGVRDRAVSASATSAASATKFQGVCWPVYAGRRLRADGSADTARPVPGVLLVSVGTIHFEPNEAKNAGMIPDLSPSETAFSYDDRQVVASMKTVVAARAGTYSFAFRGVCDGCKPGTAVLDPAKKTQLDAEYAEFQKSLTEYSAVAARVTEKAAVIEVRVEPKVEPGLEDVVDAMGLYSEMNQRLAPMCTESARACVLQFATYQACKKADLHAECGVAPACEATCALTDSGFRSLNATVCRAPKDKASMLIPDYSAAGERLRAQQKLNREKMAARGSGSPLGSASGSSPSSARVPAAASAGQVDFMGKPRDPEAGCTVEDGYAMAMMMASSRDVTGQVGASAPHAAIGSARLGAGVVASNILSKVDAVYPAVAKAAHITGAVKLHVVITEKGEVTHVTIISGPPLLQAAAADAVRQWKYKPFLLQGKPTEVDTVITVNFNFGDGKPAAAPGSGAVPDLP